MKIFERARTLDARAKQRSEIVRHLTKAMNKYPQDISLYRMALTFADSKEKPRVVVVSLKKIIDHNMMVPRTDIVFYVRESVAAGQTDLAKDFIAKAKEWYQYSRSINTAEHYLEQHSK